MLMIERQGEQYWVHFLPTNDQFSAFALTSKSFPDITSLTHFLRNTLQVPQEVIDQSLHHVLSRSLLSRLNAGQLEDSVTTHL
jgi:hypothetical protein